MNREMNRYTVEEYIERVSSIGKHEKHYTDTKKKSKELRNREINMLSERQPDPKAYERFKRKPYTAGGVPIESRRKQCEK